MECPSCYDLFNETDKTPRNLPCGHTFVMILIFNIFINSKYMININCLYIVSILYWNVLTNENIH